jgi:hypothetical protein
MLYANAGNLYWNGTQLNGGGGSSQWTTTGNDIYYTTGNVGIGDINPAHTFSINKSVNSNALVSLENTSTTGYSGIHFYDSSNTLAGHIGYANASTGNYLAGKFYVGSTAAKDVVLTTSDTARLTIASGGNIGIGTTNPQFALDMNNQNIGNVNTLFINDTGQTEGYCFIDTTQCMSIYTTTQGGYNGFTFDTTSTYPYVFKGGNVGIGDTNPSTTFSVKDSQAGGGHNSALFDMTSAGVNYQVALGTNTTRASFGTISNSDFALGTNNSFDRIYLTKGGNIGIGTTNPTALLDVSNVMRVSGNTAPTYPSGGQGFEAAFDTDGKAGSISGGSGTTLLQSYNRGTPAWNDMWIGALNTEFDANGSAAMYINSSGNIGIGTTSPTTAKLNVSGTGYISGNVGIGTTNLGAGLNVGGGTPSGANRVIIKGITDDDTFALENYNSTKKWAMTVYGNDFRLGETGVAYWLNVQATSGNVGINVTNPTHPLQIGTNGTNGNGAYLSVGGVWTNGSSKTFKDNIQTLNGQDILNKISSLPIDEWSYDNEGPDVRHIGPFAEDFYSIFGVGNDNMHISTIDPAGIALVGIQALNRNLNSLQTTINGLSGINENNTSITDAINSLSNKTGTNADTIASLSASLDSVKDQLSAVGDLNLAPFLASNSADTTITTINNGLLVMGITSLNDVSTTSLSVGNTLKIDGSSINSLGTTLAFEPLKQADIAFMGGEVNIKTDGTLTVNQNASFAKDVEVKGAATVGSLNIIKAASVDLSTTETQASASAGTTSITAGYKYRMIDSELVQSDSLIYVTPLTDTDNQVLFVTDQNPGKSFTVKVHATASADIKFNYLIVNQK